MFAELIDDSISSIVANDVKEKKVVVTISEKVTKEWDADYTISVEDSGAGIKNLSALFSFANTSAGKTTLNKYGVGLKKALVTFDVENNTIDKVSPKSRSKSKAISARVYGDTYSKFKMICEARGMTANACLNMLITDFVRENRDVLG